MYERMNRSTDNALAYRITRPLNRIEMEKIITELEGTIAASGKIRILIDLQAFPYEDLETFWQDLKFDVKHAKDLERLALVGGSKMQKWSVRLFAALTLTKCCCFEGGDVEKAWQWLLKD